MNTSNWKGSEVKAAKLFPGGRRRARVGGTYALVADDVIWGPERLLNGNPPRVVKAALGGKYSSCYIEVKKRSSCAVTTMFKTTEKKYRVGDDNRLVMVIHPKYDKRQYVMVADEFFAELIRAWCHACGLCVGEMQNEGRE